MNDQRASQEEFRTFQLMNEIEGGEAVSQRELAKRLGVAVGLVNSYLKNLTLKGWVRVKSYPRNRYTYLLTPRGFAEKSRLAYQHLSYFNDLYTVVRQDFLALFRVMKERHLEKIVFCGVDEVAEIAYLSLQEVGLELVEIIDAAPREVFLGRKVKVLSEWQQNGSWPVVLTSLKRSEVLRQELLVLGLPEDQVFMLHNYQS